MEITIGQYYWWNGQQVYVQDIRQHGWVEISQDYDHGYLFALVASHELRQCKCAFAGQMHGHGGAKRRTYKTLRPNV